MNFTSLKSSVTFQDRPWITATHSSKKKQGKAIDMQLYRSLFLFLATGCHFTGPLALRHSFSTALPIYLFFSFLLLQTQPQRTVNHSGQHLSVLTLNLVTAVFLYLIPADLISLQMQFKVAAIPPVNSGILRFVCIIYHTVSSVLYIRVNFYIIIGRKPATKLFFCG